MFHPREAPGGAILLILIRLAVHQPAAPDIGPDLASALLLLLQARLVLPPASFSARCAGMALTCWPSESEPEKQAALPACPAVPVLRYLAQVRPQGLIFQTVTAGCARIPPMTRWMLALLAGAAFLSACATGPQPCTPEWVDARVSRSFSSFALQNRALIHDIRSVARADGSLDPVQTILLAGRTQDIDRFVGSFDTVVMRDVRAAYAQCGRDERFVPAMTQFLMREGVPQPALDWIVPVLALIQVSQSSGDRQ
jgi:hypothetical protein